MFRLSLPDTPTTGHLIASAQHHHAPAPCSCPHAPAVAPRRPLAPYVAAGAGGVAAVLVVGAVLTALLAAVAITAASVTVCALVLRSLANGTNHRPR